MNHTTADFRDKVGGRGQSPLHLLNLVRFEVGIRASSSGDCVVSFRKNES